MRCHQSEKKHYPTQMYLKCKIWRSKVLRYWVILCWFARPRRQKFVVRKYLTGQLNLAEDKIEIENKGRTKRRGEQWYFTSHFVNSWCIMQTISVLQPNMFLPLRKFKVKPLMSGAALGSNFQTQNFQCGLIFCFNFSDTWAPTYFLFVGPPDYLPALLHLQSMFKQ